MNKYYGIFGSNGLGVMSEWYMVDEALKYFQSVHYKRFNNFVLAEKYSRNGFEAYVCATKYSECVAPKHLKLNELIFAKNLPKNIFDENHGPLIQLVSKC